MAIPDALASLGIQKAPVTWYCNVLALSRNRSLSVGYCGKGQGVAFIAVEAKDKFTQDSLKPLIIRDVLFKGDVCDDSKWCYCLSCPLNRAEIRYFRHYGIKSMDDLKKVFEVLRKVQSELQLKEDRLGVFHYYKKPPLKFRRV